MSAKRKMSENSLKNLEKSKCLFATDRELARKAQKKSGEKKKENKTFAQCCKIILENNQEVALIELVSYLSDPNISPETKMKILQMLADYSGQKPTEKQELTVDGIQVNINRKAIDVES